MRSSIHTFAAAAAIALLSVAAQAADQPATEKGQPAPAMRVYVDPETGTLVDHPVTAEQRAMAEQVSAELQQNPNPGWKVYPSGAIGADLEGRFEMSTVATVGSDGKVSYHCDDEDHVGHDQAAAEAPAREER